jgi:hypothetical protein
MQKNICEISAEYICDSRALLFMMLNGKKATLFK